MFSARIDRKGFILGLIYLNIPILFVLMIQIVMAVILGGTESGRETLRAVTNVMLFTVGSAWFLLFLPTLVGLYVRRWHDMNYSGWCSLLNFIPFVGYAVVLVLVFFRGTGDTDNYGTKLSPRGFDRVLFGPHNKDTQVSAVQILNDQSPDSTGISHPPVNPQI